MKALLLESKNTSFVIKDVPIPNVGDDDVLIRLKAAALNHRDHFIQQGLYPRSSFPMIIGSDGAGVVESAGRNVTRLPAGKAGSIIGTEVVINPSLNWGSNPQIFGREYKILGFPEQGTFAEFVKVPASLVHPKPKHLSWEEAAALPLAGLTAYRAVFTKGRIQPGENVLITGTGGGVALFALQFAVAAGAHVFVTSGSDQKIQKAVSLGARGGVNYKNGNWTNELTKLAASYNLIIDSAVGGGFARLLDAAAFGGRIVVYGSTQGKIHNAEPARIFWKQLTILGTTMGTNEEFVAMLRFVEEKRIVPVIDSVVPVSEANDSLRRMSLGDQFGKLVLRIA